MIENHVIADSATRSDPREGYTRALLDQALAPGVKKDGREEYRPRLPATARAKGGGWGLFPESSPRTTGAEKSGLPGVAGVSPSRLISRTLRPDFLLNCENFLTLVDKATGQPITATPLRRIGGLA
jgi:hypothetical protein